MATQQSWTWMTPAALAVVALLSLTGCGADSPPVLDAPPQPTVSVPETPAAPPSVPVPDAVEPNPPASYTPAVPAAVATTEAGYLVDRCVPESLWEHVTSLTTSDGVRLSALVLGSGPDGVVLSHEQGYDICSFLDLGQKLAADGYHVILPEYRDHGASEVSADNRDIDRDGQAALAELRRQGAQRIFVGGASAGGTVSAVLGSGIPDLTGLLIMSSPTAFGAVDGLAAVAKISAPTLLVASPGDMNGAVEAEVRRLDAASASPDKELVIQPSGFHGTQLFRNTGDDGVALEQKVLQFIERCFTG